MAKKRRPQDAKESHSPAPATVHARTRELILKIYLTSVDVDRLLTDYFPDVKQQASPGMTTDERISLLFRLRKLGEILDVLGTDAPQHEQQILEIQNACTQEELVSTDSTPTIPGPEPNPTWRRHGLLVAFIISLWEQVRAPLLAAWQNMRMMLHPRRVGLLATISMALVLLAKYLDPTVVNPLPTPSVDAAEPKPRDAADPDLSQSQNRTYVVGFRCLGGNADASIPPSNGNRLGFGKHETTARPPENKTTHKPEMVLVPGGSVPTVDQLPDLAETNVPDLARSPAVSACPESVTIEVLADSDTSVNQEQSKRKLIASMIATAKADHAVDIRQSCGESASSGSTAPIRFVSKLKIQNAVIETKKMCPPGSSKNCYDLTSRRITCEFSFAINGFTAGYSCPMGKYFAPVNFEITYHESSLDQPPWDPARRGEYAIDKCRLLAGSVVQVSVCKRR